MPYPMVSGYTLSIGQFLTCPSTNTRDNEESLDNSNSNRKMKFRFTSLIQFKTKDSKTTSKVVAEALIKNQVSVCWRSSLLRLESHKIVILLSSHEATSELLHLRCIVFDWLHHFQTSEVIEKARSHVIYKRFIWSPDDHLTFPNLAQLRLGA